jgi:hypothetical protein
VRRRFAAAYALLALVAAGATAATAAIVRQPSARAPITAAAVIAAFRAEHIALEPAGGTALGTVFLRERRGRDGRFGLFVVVAGPRSHVGAVLAGARLPGETGLVRFSEVTVANVTVRSAVERRNGSGGAAVRAAVARLR